jgi:hypothetical protein
MKKEFYRLPSSRSFVKLFSILTVAVVAFVALELFFVQQALAANVCCKSTASGCPSSFVSASNRYCEGSTACNTGYRFELKSDGSKKVCYSSVTPPQDSTSFTLSGPLTVCQFFRPDLPEEVLVSVDSLALGDITLPQGPTGPHKFNIGGMAVCGIADEVDQNYAFFDVDLEFGCVTRAASGSVITYAQLFSDLNSQTTKCPDGSEPVKGNFKGRADPPPVGDITTGSPLWTMLTYCEGGTPEVTPVSDITKCVLNSGIEVGVLKSFFEKKVCPKNPSTGLTVNGQMFAFKETIVSGGEFRPGNVAACSCQSDLDGGEVTCGQGNTSERITTNAAGAIFCEFDWQNSVAGDVIDPNGNNPVNAAIYDSASCNVSEIVKSSVRVCDGVTPTQIKVGTDNGRRALTFKVSEADCRASLQQPLVSGEIRLIYVTGELGTTHFVGSDDVIVK